MPTARNPAPQPDSEARANLSLRAWLQLMKCAKTIEAAVGARLRRKYGQSLGRYDVLSQLYRVDPDWSTVGSLAGRVMAASGNITALLDRMAAEGLVERRPSPNDRRSSQVRLSANGRALFLAMTEDHAAWVDAALHKVDAADKETLIELLSATRKAFETAEIEEAGEEDKSGRSTPARPADDTESER